MRGKALDVHTQCLVLTNLQTLSRTLADWDQQVLYPLVVDLEHGDADLVLLVLFLVVVDSSEDLFAADGDDAFVGAVADHGVGLA